MRPDDGVIAQLALLDSCSLADAIDVTRAGYVTSELHPMWEGARLAGRAVTVRLEPVPAAGAGSTVHLGVAAIEMSWPGDVIVIANEGRTEMGGWGGLLSFAAAQRQVSGVVLDGACRDVDEARELAFPVIARAAVARTARGRVYQADCGEPVTVTGTVVAPGDLVFADASGTVFLPAAAATDVIAEATRIVRREQGMQARLRAGEPLSNVLGADYESMLEERRNLRSGVDRGPVRPLNA